MGRKKELTIDKAALSARMMATEDKDEYRRLLCLWLRATSPEMALAEIGNVTGFG